MPGSADEDVVPPDAALIVTVHTGSRYELRRLSAGGTSASFLPISVDALAGSFSGDGQTFVFTAIEEEIALEKWTSDELKQMTEGGQDWISPRQPGVPYQQWCVWLSEGDGTDPKATRLRDLVPMTAATVSSDGSWLCFDHRRHGVMVLDRRSGTADRLESWRSSPQARLPRWSPVEDRLAWVDGPLVCSARPDGRDLQVMDLGLTRSLGPVAWHPSGERLAIEVREHVDDDGVLWPAIWVVDLATHDHRELMGCAQAPAWSRDGTRLVAEALDDDRPPGRHRLAVVTYGELAQRAMWPGSEGCRWPAWA